MASLSALLALTFATACGGAPEEMGATIHVESAKNEFERRLIARGQGNPPVKPEVGVPEMLAFYRDVRADDANLSEGGDMLLFQWGTYDWGSGERFEVEITRQLIPQDAAEDDDIWQLSLTYLFPPDDKLRALKEGNEWASGLSELQYFESFVLSHPAFDAVNGRTDGEAVVEFEIAGWPPRWMLPNNRLQPTAGFAGGG